MPVDFSNPLKFETRAAWSAWLAKNHASSTGVTVMLAKKGADVRSVTQAEALECALCHGWIDAQVRRIDEQFYAQRYTPRRPNSIWSQINREKVRDLIARGLMQPAGFAAIEQAKANGRWDAAYDPASKSTVPPDLAAELEARPTAAAFFATLTSQNRYAILHRLQTAKKPETRAKRLEKFVGMLERGETLH